jgi:hypothetical protein
MSGNTKYVLTDKQKEYLCDHDQPDPKTEVGIEKKFQKVPLRIQELIEDISLMCQAGYFEREDTESIWNDLRSMECYPNGRLEHRTFRQSSSEDSNGSVTELRTIETVDELGYLFGSLFHMVMTAAPDDRPWTSLLRGINLFYATVPDSDPADKHRNLKQVSRFDTLEQRPAKNDSSTEIRSVIDRDLNYEYLACREETIASSDSLIRDVLEEKGIMPGEPLIESIQSNINTIDEQTMLLDDYNKIIETELYSLIERTELRKVHRLYRVIQRDVELLKKPWRGPRRDKIIQTLLDKELRTKGKITSRDIALGLNKSLSHSLITTGLKHMSDESESSKLWTNHSLCRKQGGSWKLTPYGKLCGRYLVNDQSFIDALYDYGLKNGDIKSRYEPMISEGLYQTGLDDNS